MPTNLNQLRIALVHDWLVTYRGGERVLQALAEIFPHAPIYTLFYEPSRLPSFFSRRTIITPWWSKTPYLHRLRLLGLFAYPHAIEALDLQSYDLVLSSSSCVAKGIIPAPEALHICYSHSPMRYAWDQTHFHFSPRVQTVLGPWLSRLRQWDTTSSARCDHFIANSHYVASRIARYYHRASHVIHPFADLKTYHPDLEPHDKSYYLLVSALVPYKRIDLAIRAAEQLRVPLRIVGEGRHYWRLKQIAGPYTTFLGQVGPEKLRRLYGQARALLFPGIEDFGIVPLEAMACGTPVIAYGKGGITDSVLPGKTGLFFREQTVEALAAAMQKFETMRWSSADCVTRAHQFRKEQFQAQVMTFVETAWDNHQKSQPALFRNVPVGLAEAPLPLPTA